MGYEAALTFIDGSGARWTGAQAPRRFDVAPLFSALLEAPGALEDPDLVHATLAERGLAPARLGPRVWRLGAADGASAVLKVLLPRPKDRRVWGPSASLARRAHARAHQLRAHGIGAAAPVAFLERARGSRRAVSLTVAELVPGPSLRSWWQDHLLPRAALDPAGFVAAKRARLAEVARLLRHMHARGIFHGDLHAENLLVGLEGLVVLDLESIRRGPGAARAVDKTLERLERDLGGLGGLTRADRMRFLDAYLAGSATAASRRRALWRRVTARAARRAPGSSAGSSARAQGAV